MFHVCTVKHGLMPTSQVIRRSTGSPGMCSEMLLAVPRDFTGTRWSLTTRAPTQGTCGLDSKPSWCQDNNFHLKTKELIVDYRKRRGVEHAPLSSNRTTVERVSSFRFLGVHISDDLTWTHHTDSIRKMARQWLLFLCRLRRLNMDARILCNFYRCTIESILTGCITDWYSSCTALNCKALQRAGKSAQHVTRSELP